jgi:hypothetical protein
MKGLHAIRTFIPKAGKLYSLCVQILYILVKYLLTTNWALLFLFAILVGVVDGQCNQRGSFIGVLFRSFSPY